MDLGTIKIKNHTFDVADATISAELDANYQINWSINIEGGKKDVEGESWAPLCYIERLPIDITRLSDFAKKSVYIKSGREFCEGQILPGGRLCCLYVHEHTFLETCQLDFSMVDNRWYKLRLSANCSVDGLVLPLLIDTAIEFLGVSISEKSRDLATQQFKKVFSLDGLKVHQEPDQVVTYFLPE
jgi:hypothetical protein